MNDVIIAEQWVSETDAAPWVEAPLSPARVRALARSGEAGTAGVTLEVPGVVGLLTVRADPARAPLGAAFEEVLGLALPERLTSTTADGRRLRWMSPDEWLLSCSPAEAADIETRLRAALGDAPRVAITNVTGAWCLLVLGGPDARTVLARGVPIDIDTRAFPPGRVACTVLAKAGATLSNLGDDRYELLCRRSFAEYVARWLESATRGHGLPLLDAGSRAAPGSVPGS